MVLRFDGDGDDGSGGDGGGDGTRWACNEAAPAQTTQAQTQTQLQFSVRTAHAQYPGHCSRASGESQDVWVRTHAFPQLWWAGTLRASYVPYLTWTLIRVEKIRLRGQGTLSRYVHSMYTPLSHTLLRYRRNLPGMAHPDTVGHAPTPPPSSRSPTDTRPHLTPINLSHFNPPQRQWRKTLFFFCRFYPHPQIPARGFGLKPQPDMRILDTRQREREKEGGEWQDGRESAERRTRTLPV